MRVDVVYNVHSGILLRASLVAAVHLIKEIGLKVARHIFQRARPVIHRVLFDSTGSGVENHICSRILWQSDVSAF